MDISCPFNTNIFAIMIMAVATLPVTRLFPAQQTGFTFVAAIYGVIAIALYLICFASTKEAKHIQVRQHSLKEELGLIVKNKYLLILLAAVFFTQAANDMRTSSAIFFFKYNIGNESFYPVFMAIMILSLIAGAVFAPMLAKRLGSKRNLYIIGFIIVALPGTAVMFVPYENLALITTLLAMASTGVGITYVMIRSMIADTVEYGEWKTGIRGEGIIFSTLGVSNKLGYAVGGALTAFLLAFAGYVPDVPQSAQLQTIILYMLTLFPIIAGIIAIAIMLFYKIDDRYFDNILQEIRDGKRGGENSM